ncbi:FAD linked oxidase N-terminal [Penicillium sp. CMV-2018d]|nr:FAD linked oxidase N-terminal [Penicillium sp. CMV-2018d]
MTKPRVGTWKTTMVIHVRDASHISATLRFAHAHNIRISVKNTGYDFFGRSSVPNTLAVWTHNLDSIAFSSNFTANSFPLANSQNVRELGGGVIAADAYRLFGSKGMDITGGYEQSVGLAGGFAQCGGVGSFTTTYGLMADNSVEFEVVTADGGIRTINQCNEPELFWAMCGGGGGAFAVLNYQVPTNFTGDTSDATQNVALREILTAHAENQAEWSAELVTGQLEYLERIVISMVLLYGDNGSNFRSASASFAEFLSNRTDLSVSANEYTSYPDYANYLTVTAANAKVTEPSGIFSILASRLVPRTVFDAS